jgi:hypothetical protein
MYSMGFQELGVLSMMLHKNISQWWSFFASVYLPSQ